AGRLVHENHVQRHVEIADVDRPGEAARQHSACLPVSFSQRLRMTSQQGASISIRNARRPVCSAAIKVEPLPPNRSRTFSPLREEYCIARAASSTGFSVRWTIDCGLTFLTLQTSVALLGPKKRWAAPSFQP